MEFKVFFIVSGHDFHLCISHSFISLATCFLHAASPVLSLFQSLPNFSLYSSLLKKALHFEPKLRVVSLSLPIDSYGSKPYSHTNNKPYPSHFFDGLKMEFWKSGFPNIVYNRLC